MSKYAKRTLSAVLSLLMVFTVCPLSAGFFTASAAAYNVGDIIEFGSYPQSKITDASLKEALEQLTWEDDFNWISSSYLCGEGSSYDTGYDTRYEGGIMEYGDVEYDGARYRIINIIDYRPYYTHLPSYISGNSYQDDNGYTYGYHYFKFEPLKWRVLDPDTGLMMCESIIDSQAYSNTIFGSDPYYNDEAETTYATDYPTSSIRSWLNNNFYNTAFTEAEKTMLIETVLDNSGTSSPFGDYGSASTTDKVFLLSSADIKNTNYGFSTYTYDTSRAGKGTDYAKSQGLQVESNAMYLGNSMWWLRTAGTSSNHMSEISFDCANKTAFVFATSYGVRPAVTMQAPHTHEFTDYTYNDDANCTENGTETATCSCGETDTRIKENSALKHLWDNGVVSTAATCTSDGESLYTCSRCTETKTEVIQATNHANARFEEAVPATCIDTGFTAGTYCPDCSTWLSGHDTLDALGHLWDNGVVSTAATCTSDGESLYTCSRCTETKTEVIQATNHANARFEEAVPATCIDTGFTAGTYCPDCSTWLSGHDTLDALGHLWDNGVVSTAATCTSDGERFYTCSRCTETKTEVIQATNHANARFEEAVPATCIDTGFTAGTYCPDCSTWLSGHDTVAKIDHNDADNDGKCDYCGAAVSAGECNCICHSTGFMHFIYIIARFFWKLFGIKQTCECGAVHY